MTTSMNLFIQIIKKLLSRIIKSVSPEIFQQSCMYLPVYLQTLTFEKIFRIPPAFCPPNQGILNGCTCLLTYSFKLLGWEVGFPPKRKES